MFIDSEIQRLLDGGAIKEVFEVPKCISPIGCVPKKSGKWRIILDLRYVNEACQAPKYQNEDIRCAMNLVQSDDQLITLDISNGFLHVPVHEEHQTYLGMQWKGRMYMWMVLPFGLSSSPYFFAKTLRPVIQSLRQQGLRVMTYVDDFLLCARLEDIDHHKTLLLDTLTRLGWQINFQKSVLKPQQSIPYLGYIITSSSPQGPYVQVSPTRIRKLRKDILRALKSKCLTARALAKVAGQCISMTLAIVPGKLMVRNIYRLLSQRESWSDRLQFDPGTVSDLQWWLEALETWNYQTTVHKEIDVQMWTDASQTGWGAVCLGECAAGWWNHRLSRAPSNYRELMAVLLALKSFKGLLTNKKVQVMSDNVTTVAYLNRRPLQGTIRPCNGHLGRSGAPAGNTDCKTSPWKDKRGSRLVIKDNSQVRMASPSCLIPATGTLLGAPHSGPICIYAKHATAKLQQLSQRPTCKWSGCVRSELEESEQLCQPAISTPPQGLDLVRAQKVWATVIAPWWPAQTWAQDLIKLSVTPPIALPNSPRTFWSMGAKPEPRRNPKWRVYAWRIYGGRD